MDLFSSSNPRSRRERISYSFEENLFLFDKSISLKYILPLPRVFLTLDESYLNFILFLLIPQKDSKISFINKHCIN